MSTGPAAATPACRTGTTPITFMTATRTPGMTGHYDEHPLPHAAHDGHDHVHGPGCGHEAVPHADHADYVHDGHHHAAHDGHYDEH